MAEMEALSFFVKLDGPSGPMCYRLLECTSSGLDLVLSDLDFLASLISRSDQPQYQRTDDHPGEMHSSPRSSSS